MIGNFYAVSFAVALAVNLFLFGILASAGVWIILRLIKGAPPRARYVLTILAFLFATFIPLYLTISDNAKTEAILPASDKISVSSGKKETLQQLTNNNLSVAIFEKSLPALDSFTTAAGDFVLLKAAAILWVFGSFLFLLREIFGHLALFRRRKNLRPANDSLRKDLRCPDSIELYIGENQVPATVGFLRPQIIIPAQFPEGISISAMRRILRHEAAHARWRDPLANSILRIVRAVFWISPALWFLESVARAEQEAAADYAALKDFSISSSGDDAATAIEYADSLVKIAEFAKRTARQNLLIDSPAATNFGNSSHLENRIRRVFEGYKKPTVIRLSLSAIIITSVFPLTAFLPLASPSQSNATEKQRANEAMVFEPNLNPDFGNGENLFPTTINRKAKVKEISENDRQKIESQPTPEKRQTKRQIESKPVEPVLPQKAQPTETPQPVVPPVPVIKPKFTVKPSIAVKPVMKLNIEPQENKQPD